MMEQITAAKHKLSVPLSGSKLDNQDGMVLIIVLITLVLLTFLGATLIDSTTSELKIAGNARNTQDAFYSADAALNFVETYDQIYTALSSSSPSWPSNSTGTYLNSAANPTLGSNGAATSSTTLGAKFGNSYNAIVLPNGDTAFVQVKFVGTGNVPPGYGTQESSSLSGTTSFIANYVVATATASPNNNSGASVTVEAQFAKIVPQGGQ